jgi:hypothetical protein
VKARPGDGAGLLELSGRGHSARARQDIAVSTGSCKLNLDPLPASAGTRLERRSSDGEIKGHLEHRVRRSRFKRGLYDPPEPDVFVVGRDIQTPRLQRPYTIV